MSLTTTTSSDAHCCQKGVIAITTGTVSTPYMLEAPSCRPMIQTCILNFSIFYKG
mgnify:CR=1 FL=1